MKAIFVKILVRRYSNF